MRKMRTTIGVVIDTLGSIIIYAGKRVSRRPNLLSSSKSRESLIPQGSS